MDTTQIKTFWQRPEGTTGKVLVAGMIALAAFGFIHFNVLGFLITLADNMIHLAVSLGILALIGFTVTADRPRTLLFYALQSISRAITRNFVEIDPIGILRAFVKDMEKKRETVGTAIEKMMGVRAKSQQARNLKDKEMKEAAKMADAAASIGNQEKFQEMQERIGRRVARINQLDENIAFTNTSIDTLQRVDRVIEYNINNANDEADEMASDYDMAISMLAASHAANEALGDTDKLTVRNMAADVVRDKVAQATATVEHLMETTRSVQNEMDLNKLVIMQNGAQKLAELRDGVTREEQSQLQAKKPVQATARLLTTAPITNTIPSTGNRWAERLNSKRPE